MKYKLKVKRRREKIPVCRDFPGRSLAAKIKLRKDGKFANVIDDKDNKKLSFREKSISENLENGEIVILVNDSE